MKNSDILRTIASADYELIDSGEGEKLERFGTHILSRPDPQALWRKRLSPAEWKKAGAHFTREEKGGGWSLKEGVPSAWDISFGGLKLRIKPTAFKHTGLFPEQEPNWEWMKKKIQDSRFKIQGLSAADAELSTGRGLSERAEIVRPEDSSRPDRRALRDREASSASPEKVPALAAQPSDIEVLNLFGYTGGATLACAQAGAKVVHIDSSKAAVAWARDNAELSGLADKPIRWIIEDARVFVSREIKRGRKYGGILMDPPAFGHGPAAELWKIEEHFLALMEDCMKLLSDKPVFFLVNGYSAGYSAIAYENNLLSLVKKFGGALETGELVIEETKKAGMDSRLLPAGIFVRWSR